MSGRSPTGRRTTLATIAALCLIASGCSATGAGHRAAAPPTRPSAVSRSAIARLPLRFVRNDGQVNGAVRFYTAGPNDGVAFLDHGLTYRLERPSAGPGRSAAGRTLGQAVALDFVGGRPGTGPEGTDPAAQRVNYLSGTPASNHSRVPTFGGVTYRRLWPGIDLQVSGDGRHVESTYRVAAGADPSAIRLGYRGATDIRIRPDGSLVIETPVGPIVERRPVVYQSRDGRREVVPSSYTVARTADDTFTVGFHLGDYDHSAPLLIDPFTLLYAGYLGGTGIFEFAYAIDAGPDGSLYATGTTKSHDFPTTPGALDETYNGDGPSQEFGDAYVVKISPSGNQVVYSTFLSGDDDDVGFGIKVDASGRAFVTGRTASSNFPTTPGTVGPARIGGRGDAFVTRLSPDGSTAELSTYVGGDNGIEFGDGIDLGSDGSVYVVGRTGSSTYPTTTGAFQPTYAGLGDDFALRLAPDFSHFIWSSFVGGNDVEREGSGIAVGSDGSAYITGTTASANFPLGPGGYDTSFNGVRDIVVLKIAPDGRSITYGTFLGGNAQEREGGSIVVDASGSAYVTGTPDSSDFPTTPGAFDRVIGSGNDADVSVTKLTPNGTGLVYSTFIGGTGGERTFGIELDPTEPGTVWVDGITSSSDYPTTVDGFQQSANGNWDLFVTKVAADGQSLRYSSFLGASGNDGHLGDDTVDVGRGIAVDGSGSVYVSGSTASPSFPVTPGAFDTTFAAPMDGFVAKLGSGSVALSALAIEDRSIKEPPNGSTTTLRFRVTRSTPTAATVTVAYATQNGSATAGQDYTAASGTLTFKPGVVSKVVKVVVNGDSVNDPLETFTVNLSNPVNATIADDTGIGTIK